MKTYHRICIEDYTLKAQSGDCFSFERGKEYITSRKKKNKVFVFSRYWVWVPARVFAGAERFT